MTLESQSQYPSVLSSIFVATEDRNLLALLCSHLSQCHHRAEWPVVCSGVHYYNIRSYLEYTNRLTALHWSRRKKGTEAHMSGIFQNIEPLRHLGYTCRLSLTLLGTTLLWWLRTTTTDGRTDGLTGLIMAPRSISNSTFTLLSALLFLRRPPHWKPLRPRVTVRWTIALAHSHK